MKIRLEAERPASQLGLELGASHARGSQYGLSERPPLRRLVARTKGVAYSGRFCTQRVCVCVLCFVSPLSRGVRGPPGLPCGVGLAETPAPPPEAWFRSLPGRFGPEYKIRAYESDQRGPEGRAEGAKRPRALLMMPAQPARVHPAAALPLSELPRMPAMATGDRQHPSVEDWGHI